MNQSVRWEITSKCNLNCRHCAVHEVHKEDLPIGEAKKLVDHLVVRGVNEILFSTKEPFAYKDFWELLAYCTQMNIYAKILTNATLLSEEDVKRLYKYKIKMLCISLDGWTEEDNDRIRGKGTFQKILQVIEWFHKYNIDSRYPYIQIFIQNCITGENVRHVDRIPELFNRYPEVNISLTPIMLLGNAKSNPEARTDRAKYLEYQETLYTMTHRLEPALFIRERNYFSGVVNNFHYALNELPVIPSCGARNEDRFAILSDGKLCKCIMLLDSGVQCETELIGGDAVKDTGGRNWMVSDHMAYKENPVCKRCPIKESCELCLAVSMSPAAFVEYLADCRGDMEQFEDLVDQIANGKVPVKANDSLVMRAGCITELLRTKETARIDVEPEIYHLLETYTSQPEIPESVIGQLTKENIRLLLTNNLIWKAGK